MNVGEIIKKYLEDNGYDGLAGEECGCVLEDLYPCNGDRDVTHCVPGHRVNCDCDDPDLYDDECEYFPWDRKYHVVPGKKEGDTHNVEVLDDTVVVLWRKQPRFLRLPERSACPQHNRHVLHFPH